jgi:hypothetical protein
VETSDHARLMIKIAMNNYFEVSLAYLIIHRYIDMTREVAYQLDKEVERIV